MSDDYDQLLRTIRNELDHARKRQKTDVVFPDAKPFWQGYIAALAQLVSGEEVRKEVAEMMATAGKEGP